MNCSENRNSLIKKENNSFRKDQRRHKSHSNDENIIAEKTNSKNSFEKQLKNTSKTKNNDKETFKKTFIEENFNKEFSKGHMSALLRNNEPPNSMSLPRDLKNFSNKDIMHACCRKRLMNNEEILQHKRSKLNKKNLNYELNNNRSSSEDEIYTENEVISHSINSLWSSHLFKHRKKCGSYNDSSIENSPLHTNKKLPNSISLSIEPSVNKSVNEKLDSNSNPQLADKIDSYSRALFPLTFLILNSLYWIIYLSIKPSFSDDGFIYVS